MTIRRSPSEVLVKLTKAEFHDLVSHLIEAHASYAALSVSRLATEEESRHYRRMAQMTVKVRTQIEQAAK